jgi:hypothetical protein
VESGKRGSGASYKQERKDAHEPAVCKYSKPAQEKQCLNVAGFLGMMKSIEIHQECTHEFSGPFC